MNKPHTADSCARMSRSMTGRQHKLGYQTSPETRALMRASSNSEGRRELTYTVHQRFTTMYPRAELVATVDPKKPDYMIDGMRVNVRGATLNRAHRWHFTLLKNTGPDRFFFLLFDIRTSHIPTYAFCIPGNVINHLTGVSISEKTLTKWAEWAIDLPSIDRKV